LTFDLMQNENAASFILDRAGANTTALY